MFLPYNFAQIGKIMYYMPHFKNNDYVGDAKQTCFQMKESNKLMD